MLKKLFRLLFIIGLASFWGCMAFHHTPVQKENHLFAWQITKNQIDIIKNTIIGEEYKRIRENFIYAGALRSQYAKELSYNGFVYKISILLSFKTTKNAPDVYRNLGVSIITEGKGCSETDAELDRMENILYKKLVELVGTEYVERDNQESKMPKGLEEIEEK